VHLLESYLQCLHLFIFKKIDVYIKQHARSMEIYIEHNIEFSFRNLVDYIEKRGFDVFEMQRSKIKTLDKDLGVLIFSLDLVKKVNHQEVLNHLNEIEGIEYVKEIA
jgi:putative Mg2+ transporter-C (MgtC) family protein